MDSDYKRRVIRVVYFSFVDSGGMLHYAQNLAIAYGEIAESGMVVMGAGKSLANIVDSSAMMCIKWSRNSLSQKLLEIYNPLFYKRLARKICRELRPDIVHITSNGVGLLSFVNALRAQDVKVVYTIHDPVPHEERTTTWGWVVRKYQAYWQGPRVIRQCAAVHVHSNSHLELLKQLHGEQAMVSTYVVPHGGGLTRQVMEGEAISPELEGRHLVDLPSVLFFGRIEPYKGLDYLLEAIGIMEQNGMRVNLIIAGAGKIAKDLLSVLESNVISINRFIDDAEIKSIFEASDVVVLPYVSATQSGVIPMAYAFGKPVVSTDVGALGEMVLDGETGLLVAPKDSKQLAETLMPLLRDSAKLKSMGNSARQHMMDNLDWRIVVHRHLTRYQKLYENA